VLNFTEIWVRCFERYKKQAFANICNITLEYPCFLTNVDDPHNLTLNRPCIELKRIGDGHVDRLGKSDERNLLKCDTDVLGWRFGCTGSKGICSPVFAFCTDLFPCPTNDKLTACFYKNDSNCNGPKDIMCLNGTCHRNARCNGKWECLNGEDEYWCYFDSDRFTTGRTPYRNSRRIELHVKMTLTRYLGPSNNQTYTQLYEPSFTDRIQQISMKLHARKQMRNVDTDMSDDMIIDEVLQAFRSDSQLMLLLELPFICNRGIPIKHGN
jgi:hypothetical protein